MIKLKEIIETSTFDNFINSISSSLTSNGYEQLKHQQLSKQLSWIILMSIFTFIYKKEKNIELINDIDKVLEDNIELINTGHTDMWKYYKLSNEYRLKLLKYFNKKIENHNYILHKYAKHLGGSVSHGIPKETTYHNSAYRFKKNSKDIYDIMKKGILNTDD